MIRRCFDTESHVWHWYGGRGIGVCERWLEFENFLADMGERPPGRSIERIDNDGWYEPTNCRWATHKEQLRNMRRNRMVEYNGRRMCSVDWAADRGINRGTLEARLKRGWTAGAALGFEAEPKSKEIQKPRILQYGNQYLPLREWAVKTGISHGKIRSRLDLGWTVGQALGFEPR